MTMNNEGRATLDRLRPLALLALGKTGADIERLVREVRRASRRSGRAIGWRDLEAALRAGEAAMSVELRRRAAVHEAGHALVYTLTGIAQVQSVSIGLGDIGMVTTTMNNSLAQTEAWLMRSITCLLAGRVAERMMIGDVVAGGGGADDSDLAQATSLALAAETSLGFSAHQPLLYRSPGVALAALGHDPQLAARVHRRLERGEGIARELVEAHRDALGEIVAVLEGNGILSGEDVRLIVQRATATAHMFAEDPEA
ncbi:ATP-dependent Zn protease [Rhizobium sp. YIM 134829]|uniref:ATP-dependent Zn protease n=1 Tax=Rhizobium sp. YIM 134829 TaxID=3390453 RepID=UPI00397E8143